MSLIKKNILFNSQDMNVKFTLSSKNDFTGYQQEIDKLALSTSINSINPVSDEEVRKFKLAPDVGQKEFTFLFFYNDTYLDYFPPTFLGSGGDYNSTMFNSFFIMDFYDSYNIKSQTKIFTTYLTKVGGRPIYDISADPDINGRQLYYWYVPLSYINAHTGTTCVGYIKFSFFCAKTGTIINFYNAYITQDTPEKLFFKVELNLLNKTWKIIDSPFVNAKELINADYANKINATFDKTNNQTQSYPENNTRPKSNTYDYETNSYRTT